VTLLVPQVGAIPRPHPSPMSQPFWDGLANGELKYQECAACGGAVHTPALVCGACGSTDLAWRISGGSGTVYSWTTVWRPQTPEFIVPYMPIVVDLDEGFQMLSNLIGCDHEAVDVGQPVAVVFHRLADGFTLAYFQPVAD
jgi:uncharacterized OB-fold protein